MLFILFCVGFFYRAYPHLVLVPRWIIEEEYNFVIVKDLIRFGETLYPNSYPILEHLLIYNIYKITNLSPIILSQYANPFLGALTIVPLYFLLKRYLTTRQTLCGCLFWTLSEAAFYRASSFGSTEVLGFLLSLSVLTLYVYKRYVWVLILFPIALYSHLLPSIFIFGVMALDLFMKSSKKQKVVVIFSGVSILLFLASPLNPHGRILHTLNFSTIVLNFDVMNIFLYSLPELISGVFIFGGFVCLVLVTFAVFTRKQMNNNVMNVFLFLAAGLFFWSWIDYSPGVFAPPRLTFYFLVPLIYYSVKFVTESVATHAQFIVCVIGLIMVGSAVVGTPTMLFIDDCVTKEEYEFLDKLPVTVETVDEWWTDYPLRVSLESRYEGVQVEIFNELSTRDYTNPFVTMTESQFKYVLITPRMERSSLFFVYPKRTVQIRKPIADIWANSSLWKLLVEENGIKLYKRVGT